MARFTRMYRKMQEALSHSSDEDLIDVKTKCTFCTSLVRVEHFSQLKPGDHICMGGEHGMFNIGKRQVSFYKHHAIVKDIELIDNTSAYLNLVHFTPTANDSDILIQETKDKKNLHNDELYLVKYRHGTHPVDEILKRADSIVKTKETKKYKLFQCNCEHFCQWCCIGSEDSFQVENVKLTLESISAGTGGVVSKILKAACEVVLFSVDDLSLTATTCLIGVPWGVLSVAAVAYLIYGIYRHIQLNKRLSQGTICPACCRQQKLELWSRFAVFCLAQAGGLGLVSLIVSAGCCSGGAVFGIVAVVGILTLVLMWGIPKLIQKFKSPFAGKRVRVKSFDNIWIGDIISIKEKGHLHDCVVSAVKVFPNTDNKNGEIKVVHYSHQNKLRSKRKIKEDVMEIKLKKDLVLGHVYTSYKVHPPEIVVKRARKRIGETKYGLLSNRSTHLCHWAKVDEDCIDEDVTDIPTPVKYVHRELDLNKTISGYERATADHRRGRNFATKTTETTARIREDIKAGQLIRFKYRGFPHTALTSKVDYSRKVSVIKVTVVHYGTAIIVREEKITFNLNTDDVTIIRYHQVDRYGKEEIIKRARAKIGESKYSYLGRRSKHLAHDVVQKDVDQLASSMDDIKRGDIVTYYCWLRKHDAVVTNVRAHESKANNKGDLTIIHYAPAHIFSTRTVQEDTIFVDLSTDDVFVKGYEGVYTYSADNVVKRSRERIGEHSSAIGNRNLSKEFAHWAKVIQEPSLVSEDNGREKLIIPRIADKTREKFQRTRVCMWSDLSPGTLIEFPYYHIWHPGILTEANEGSNSIKAIHYGADHLFAKRTIMESTITVDLKNDKFWKYQADPKNCNKPDMIVKIANGKLGEQDWKRGNTSWHFCKSCILKIK